jgi:hypothetical protein
MKNALMRRIASIRRLLPRMLIGAVFGIAVVVLYFSLDYLGETDKERRRFYFTDQRDAFVTLLTAGIVIGAAVGFGWAISSKERNQNGEKLAERTPETRSPLSE